MMWSGVDVIEGRMTGGELGAFALRGDGGLLSATLSEVGDLQRAAGAAERLVELLAETSEIPIPDDCGGQQNILEVSECPVRLPQPADTTRSQ